MPPETRVVEEKGETRWAVAGLSAVGDEIRPPWLLVARPLRWSRRWPAGFRLHIQVASTEWLS